MFVVDKNGQDEYRGYSDSHVRRAGLIGVVVVHRLDRLTQSSLWSDLINQEKESYSFALLPLRVISHPETSATTNQRTKTILNEKTSNWS